MSITPISESAARVITSTLALHDAISVVKELLDNALDSKANNISVEISQNALDIIQVKDNGSAILEQDRRYLCKRGYTSKIRTIDDLAQLGGTFLGFRGEALASVAQLSKNTTITTRVDGEVAATALVYDAQGDLISSSPASYGAGTTVRVTDFLYNIPVRRESALKRATRTLTGTKRLLVEYALARPTIKFQLKVLKTPKDKANWLYTPSKNEYDLVEIARKVVGGDLVNQCRAQSIVSEDQLYRIHALLAATECDVQKLGGAGQFVSIDGRPVTTERGFIKELCKIYRCYLRQTNSHEDSLPLKPFLYLRIHCPRGSYDVNIEPAKNEVLFEDQASVLNLFETMCRDVYGEKEVEVSVAKVKSRSALYSIPSFDLLLSDKSAPKAATSLELRENDIDEPSDGAGSILLLPQSRESKFDSAPASASEPTEEDVMNPLITNPFTLAKLTTRIPARKSTDQLPGLPLIDISSPVEQPGIQPSLLRNAFLEARQPRTTEDANHVDHLQAASEVRSQQSLLETWRQSVSSKLINSTTPDDTMAENSPSDKIMLPQPSTPPSAQSTDESPKPNAMRKLNTKPFRTPFKQPTGHPLSSRTEAALKFADGQTLLPTPSPTPRPHGPQFPGFRHPLQAQSDAELDEIMEFERRKRNTINQHREHVRQRRAKPRDDDLDDAEYNVPSSSVTAHGISSTQDSMRRYAREIELDAAQVDEDDDIPRQPNSAGYTQNPHWNRYRKAVRELDKPRNDHPTRPHAHPLTDPDNLTATSRRPASKSKQSTLHKRFENIDDQNATYHFLAQPAAPPAYSNSSNNISRAAELLKSIDGYIRSGYKHGNLALDLDSDSQGENHSTSSSREELEEILRRLLKESIVRHRSGLDGEGLDTTAAAAAAKIVDDIQFTWTAPPI